MNSSPNVKAECNHTKAQSIASIRSVLPIGWRHYRMISERAESRMIHWVCPVRGSFNTWSCKFYQKPWRVCDRRLQFFRMKKEQRHFTSSNDGACRSNIKASKEYKGAEEEAEKKAENKAKRTLHGKQYSGVAQQLELRLAALSKTSDQPTS